MLDRDGPLAETDSVAADWIALAPRSVKTERRVEQAPGASWLFLWPIHAGTKYLAFLLDRYFEDPAIDEENRLAFSWAAYNAGPAKVAKMRKRAEEMGLDPNRWFGHVEHAALAIVGQETVRYVGNIYKYYVAYKLVANITEREAEQDL